MELFQAGPSLGPPVKEVRFRVPTIFWIVVLAFLIRLVFLLAVPPLPIHEGGDDGILYYQSGLQIREYFRKAGPLLGEFSSGQLFHGRGLLEKYGLEIPWGALERGLTYPLFLALIFWTVGPDPFFVFVLQAFLMSSACGLVYGIGKELGEPRVGLLGAFLMGIYPPYIFIVSKPFQESLAVFFFSLFYFLAFRSQRKSSPWIFSVAGGVLFLLSLSKSVLAFFPLFLFAGITLMGAFLKRKWFPRNAWIGILSFLVPYGIWFSVVSWQLHRPAIVGETVGPFMMSALLPHYEGWVPDTFQGSKPDREAAEDLKEQGILETSSQEAWEWPAEPKMIFAALRILWEHPGASLRLLVEKFSRFWWKPYDWPWRNFLFSPDPLYWFHRSLVLAGLLGSFFWISGRPLALSLLLAPALYGTLLHSLFPIESRYGTVFFILMLPGAGFFFNFFWKNRRILFTAQKITMGFIALSSGGILFYLSRLPFLWTIFPFLDAARVHRLGVGIQSVLLGGLFLILVFWLRPVLPRKCLVTCFLACVLAIFIPFEVHALSPQYGLEWEAPISSPRQGVRQEIFLPRGSLGDSIRQNLRLDLELPREGKAWGIWVNGEKMGTLEELKENLPFELLIPPYQVYIQDMRKEPFQVRQWFILPLPSPILKEGAWNIINIRAEEGDGEETLPLDSEWKIFGDYPFSFSEHGFFGPLFHRSGVEVSMHKFQFDGDFRLQGRVPLRHRGTKSLFFNGSEQQVKDLSPEPGIQGGEYRIRIEMELPGGKFLVY